MRPPTCKVTMLMDRSRAEESISSGGSESGVGTDKGLLHNGQSRAQTRWLRKDHAFRRGKPRPQPNPSVEHRATKLGDNVGLNQVTSVGLGSDILHNTKHNPRKYWWAGRHQN